MIGAERGAGKAVCGRAPALQADAGFGSKVRLSGGRSDVRFRETTDIAGKGARRTGKSVKQEGSGPRKIKALGGVPKVESSFLGNPRTPAGIRRPSPVTEAARDACGSNRTSASCEVAGADHQRQPG